MQDGGQWIYKVLRPLPYLGRKKKCQLTSHFDEDTCGNFQRNKKDNIILRYCVGKLHNKTYALQDKIGEKKNTENSKQRVLEWLGQLRV